MPKIAKGARERLAEDVRLASASGQLGDVTPELAFEFAVGVVLQAMQAAADGRLLASQTHNVVSGVLRAIGVAPEVARDIALRVGASVSPGLDEPSPAAA